MAEHLHPALRRLSAGMAAPNDLSEEREDIDEAKRFVRLLTAEIESGQARTGAFVFSDPQCRRACSPCFLSCVARHSSLNWWRKELASLTGGLIND